MVKIVVNHQCFHLKRVSGNTFSILTPVIVEKKVIKGCSFPKSGNSSLCQLVPFILVSVEACGAICFVSHGDRGTDKPAKQLGVGMDFYLFCTL